MTSILRRVPGLPRRSLRWWTQKELDALFEMRSAGMTWPAIGAHLERKPSAVRDKWYRARTEERIANKIAGMERHMQHVRLQGQK